MRRAFDGQKRPQRYDHNAIAQMARTMSRRQIMDKIGISKGYLAQILAAKGVKFQRKPQLA